MGEGLAVEDQAPAGVDGLFEEDVLDGQGVLFADVELAASLGLADMDPVGGAIAGATEALAFAEGFDEDGPGVPAWGMRILMKGISVPEERYR